MTEDARWDYRVTIRYKNSTVATTANPDEGSTDQATLARPGDLQARRNCGDSKSCAAHWIFRSRISRQRRIKPGTAIPSGPRGLCRCADRDFSRDNSSPSKFLERLDQAFVRKLDSRMTVPTGHGCCADHGVDDGLLGGFYGRCEERTDFFVGHSENRVRSRCVVGVGICSGECEEDIPGAVSRTGAVRASPSVARRA